MTRIAVVYLLAITLVSGLACGGGEELSPSSTPINTQVIEATITEFYDALNNRDKPRFESMLADGAEAWLATLALAESLDLVFNIDYIGEPQFIDDVCLVELTTTAIAQGIYQIDEATDTEMIKLVFEYNSWKVSVFDDQVAY